VLVTNVRNFPNDRGSVLGVCKVGLELLGTLACTTYHARVWL